MPEIRVGRHPQGPMTVSMRPGLREGIGPFAFHTPPRVSCRHVRKLHANYTWAEVRALLDVFGTPINLRPR